MLVLAVSVNRCLPRRCSLKTVNDLTTASLYHPGIDHGSSSSSSLGGPIWKLETPLFNS